LNHGEDRLLCAVEKGQIPLTVAIKIAIQMMPGSSGPCVEAYEDKTLRGRKLLAVRRIIEQRPNEGKTMQRPCSPQERAHTLG